MLHLPTVQDNLAAYKEAGFPILYICTDEEDRADRYIESIVGRAKAYEWNGANGVVDFKTKVAKTSVDETLTEALSTFEMGRELNRTLLVIKDADKQLDDHEGNVLAISVCIGKGGISGTIPRIPPDTTAK